jgi:hypothetical protein
MSRLGNSHPSLLHKLPCEGFHPSLQCSTFVRCLLCNKSKIKFMHNTNKATYNREQSNNRSQAQDTIVFQILPPRKHCQSQNQSLDFTEQFRSVLRGNAPYSGCMLLPVTEWVDFLVSRDDEQGKIHRSCQKYESLSLHDVIIFFVCNKMKVKLCTSLNTERSTEIKCIFSHVQNTILLTSTYL